MSLTGKFHTDVPFVEADEQSCPAVMCETPARVLFTQASLYMRSMCVVVHVIIKGRALECPLISNIEDTAVTHPLGREGAIYY